MKTQALAKMIIMKGEMSKLSNKIKKLTPAAVRDLRKYGFSHDEISRMLGIGKINSIKFSKKKVKYKK